MKDEEKRLEKLGRKLKEDDDDGKFRYDLLFEAE